MLAVKTRWGYFLWDYALFGFLSDFLLLAGFLLIDVDVASLTKVEFYGSTNPV